jgi:putative ABC transport system permease protein
VSVRRFLARLAGTVRPSRGERDLSDELESHLQLDIDERVKNGATPDEARRQALLALGGLDATKERIRDQRRLRPLEDLAHDLRYALRTLAKDRLFTAVVIATFALGVGANTAIFGAVDAVLLQPLPFPDDEHLVTLAAVDQKDGESRMPVTPADFADWRAATRSYAAVAASSDGIFTLTGEGEPESIIGYRFAPEMFGVLGVPAGLGRTFAAADDADVVGLADGLWRRRFHADPTIVGRSIRLDHKSYLVVGVMPPSFQHPHNSELWVPLVVAPDVATSRTRAMLRLVGRLRPGVSVGDARGELRTVAASLAAAHPDTNRFRGAEVAPLRRMYTGDARPALLVLLAAAGFVLLVTSSNIAGLSLARAATRGREIAVRSALGARRSRIVRQLLTESLLLAVAGGAAGLLLAAWGADLLAQLFPRNVANLAMPTVERIPLDGKVVLFSFGVTLAAGVLAGLAPAIRVSRPDLAHALKEGGRGSAAGSRVRPWLVAGQIALALVLSAAAGLVTRSLVSRQRDIGFEPAGAFTARVLLDPSRYPDATRRRQFLADLLPRLRGAPGVRAAGVVSFLPLCGWSSGTEWRDAARPDEPHDAGLLIAEPGYFSTMSIPIVRGRGFADGDTLTAPKVLLVDQRFVHRFFADADPLGRRINLGSVAEPDWREIVGVVGDVANEPPPDAPQPMVYLPFSQEDFPYYGVVARADGDPTALAATIRDVVASIDRDQPVSYAWSLSSLVSDAFAVEHTSTIILSFFAVLAVVLAAMGVYGVLAHNVLERRHDLAIRVALGASRRHVLGFMLRRLAIMTGAGLVVGVAGTLAAARVLQALLYGVSAHNPALLVTVVLLLALVALAAGWIPLRQAMRTDPMAALREQ